MHVWHLQGSICPPPHLLFIIYINDLHSRNLLSKVRMYADNANRTSDAEDPDVVEFQMNHDMNLIDLWLKTNNLTLNIK